MQLTSYCIGVLPLGPPPPAAEQVTGQGPFEERHPNSPLDPTAVAAVVAAAVVVAAVVVAVVVALPHLELPTL